MVASMTAFGRAGDDLLDWQIRSVNHRYLELGFRLPEPLRDIERALRDKALARLGRGKVDAVLRLGAKADPAVRIDAEALARVLGSVAALRGESARGDVPIGAVDPLELLRWPGVAAEDEAAVAALRDAALTAFDAALSELAAHRESEGARLAALLRRRLEELESLAGEARALAEAQRGMLGDRLRERLRELACQAPPERLAQEAALLAQKADVAEELDRLDIHIAEARAALDGAGPRGRRLDFLMQELGREANTLAAKSVLPESAKLAVDIKVVVEQMREQVQNVE